MHSKKRSFPLLAVVILIAILAATPGPARAGHSFLGLHWPRDENRFAVRYGDNVSSGWDAHLRSAAEEWSESPVLRARVVRGSVDPSTCDPIFGRVEVCSFAYGTNNILFEAIVFAIGDHIVAGIITLNDTYLNDPPFNTRVWRRHILCQLIGFTVGLDMQDFDFSNRNLGTCMDLTNDPSARPRNTEPNRHDFNMLAQIYAHLDDDDDLSLAASGLSAAGGAGASAAQDAGALLAASPDGRTALFEKDLGNGVKTLHLVGRAE